MEEKKKNNGKVVNMQGVQIEDKQTSQPQKLTYEQLNQACAEMSQQLQNQNRYIQQIRQQVQQMDYALQTKRMDYLFKVVSLYAEHPLMFDEGFVKDCIDEIQESLTIPVEEPEAEKKEG